VSMHFSRFHTAGTQAVTGIFEDGVKGLARPFKKEGLKRIGKSALIAGAGVYVTEALNLGLGVESGVDLDAAAEAADATTATTTASTTLGADATPPLTADLNAGAQAQAQVAAAKAATIPPSMTLGAYGQSFNEALGRQLVYAAVEKDFDLGKVITQAGTSALAEQVTKHITQGIGLLSKPTYDSVTGEITAPAKIGPVDKTVLHGLTGAVANLIRDPKQPLRSAASGAFGAMTAETMAELFQELRDVKPEHYRDLNGSSSSSDPSSGQVDWTRYHEAKQVSALLAKVSTAFTAAVLDPRGKTIDVALANEAAEQALRYNFLVAPLVLPLAVPLMEGVAALVAAGVSYCTAQHIMAAYERGDFDIIAHNLMEVGDVIVDRVGQGIQYFLKGESYRSPQDVVEAYLRDAMRAAVPFEARGDKPVHGGASHDPVHRSSGYGSSAYPGAKADLDGYAGARTGFHNEAEADGLAQGQGLNLTPTDHGGGSILGTPAHQRGLQIFDTPVYDDKPEPFVTPLPETGSGSLVTPIPA
ncbi:MAG: hypothetical protein AAF085_17720, partial [Planctomycetota bacterium]